MVDERRLSDPSPGNNGDDVRRMKKSPLGHKTAGAARRIFSLTLDATKRAIRMSLRDLDQRCSLCPPSDTGRYWRREKIPK